MFIHVHVLRCMSAIDRLILILIINIAYDIQRQIPTDEKSDDVFLS